MWAILTVKTENECITIADWLLPALKILKPPEKLTVAQWADKHRVLDIKTSNEPGKWKTSKTPYLKEILNTFINPVCEEIVFIKPTQVGGTECILNCLGYIIDQDQGPTMVVYPSSDLAESISKTRIKPMFELCKTLKSKYDENASKLLELQFKGMYISLTGANSPSQLSSKPMRYLFLDEIDKYPAQAGKEADPISLATERTKTYEYNRKVFKTSTPTLKTGAITKAFESCDTKKEYRVPCPFCGEFIPFRFRQIKWGEAKTAEERQKAAYYECQHCGEHIKDYHKDKMLKGGKWFDLVTGNGKEVGFQLNAIYSPWVKFGDVAYEYTKSKKDPEKLMNFVNSWLGEPWEQVGTTSDSEKVLSKQSPYTRGVVPKDTVFITGGIDVQRDCQYYTVRAWGYEKKSYNIDHGKTKTFDELAEIFGKFYHDENGKSYMVNLVLMDSGDQTEDVYNFCYLNSPQFVAVKGSSTPIASRFRQSKISKEDSVAEGLPLINCDGGYYKDMIYNRLKKEDGNWYVFDGCDKEYAQQITNEHKVFEGNKWVWKLKFSGADNHYLDTEVYSACAADILGAFELLQPPQHQPQNINRATQQQRLQEQQEEEDWL